MKINTFIGRRLDYINGILRRQLELDRFLKKHEDLKIKYICYNPPSNFLDFFAKRYILYPIRAKKSESSKNGNINSISAQFLSDLIYFLSEKYTIITVHDIFNFIEVGNIKNPFPIQKYILSGLKRCKYIVSISEFTKNELINRFNISSEKIFVIKNGISRDVFYPLNKTETQKKKELYPGKKILLHVGSEEYRKDIPTLFKALYLVKKEIKNILLIRVGTPKHLSIIKNLNLEKNVKYFEKVANTQLREIYCLSDLFIFPSLYEGWGFPGLEAAACGTPVIASDIPVFKEVYQDFPLYFKSGNYKELAEKIIKTLNNDSLKEKMYEKGLSISMRYDWNEASEKYYKLIKVIQNSK